MSWRSFLGLIFPAEFVLVCLHAVDTKENDYSYVLALSVLAFSRLLKLLLVIK